MMKSGVLAKNIALLVLSTVISIGCAELLVRAFASQLLQIRPVLAVSPENKLRFVAGSSETYRTSEFQFTNAVNRFGRRDIEWDRGTLDAEQNILFIGDSFVFGYGVDNEFSVPSLLEAALSDKSKNIEVFNFGMPGSIAFAEYAQLFNEADEIGIKARTVVVGLFIGNDFSTPGELLQPEAMVYPGNNLQQKPSWSLAGMLPDLMLLQFVGQAIQRSNLATKFVLSISGKMGKYPDAIRSVQLFDSNISDHFFFQQLEPLKQLVAICRERGIHIVVAFFPSMIQVEQSKTLAASGLQFDRPNQALHSFCKDLNIPCLDLIKPLTEHFQRTGESLFFPVDRHLNVSGNKVVAEALLPLLH